MNGIRCSDAELLPDLCSRLANNLIHRNEGELIQIAQALSANGTKCGRLNETSKTPAHFDDRDPRGHQHRIRSKKLLGRSAVGLIDVPLEQGAGIDIGRHDALSGRRSVTAVFVDDVGNALLGPHPPNRRQAVRSQWRTEPTLLNAANHCANAGDGNDLHLGNTTLCDLHQFTSRGTVKVFGEVLFQFSYTHVHVDTIAEHVSTSSTREFRPLPRQQQVIVRSAILGT